MRSQPNSKPTLHRSLYVDYGGSRRTKVSVAPHTDRPIRVANAVSVLTSAGSLPKLSTMDASGEALMVPGSRTVKIPWHNNHEMSIANLMEEVEATSETYDTPFRASKPWVHCSRACLLRAVDLLKKRDITIRAGFEMEFMLFKLADDGSARLFGNAASYASFDQFDMAATCLDDMISTLAEMDIDVLLVHAEAAYAQYELVLDHKDVLSAVDDVVMAREAVRAIARKHGLHASFIPHHHSHPVGNGGHVHLSLEGHFATEDTLNGQFLGVSETGQQFMAGVLDALPWLLCLLMISPNSYDRLRPLHWVGAYQCWAVNNKEAPIRLSEDRSNFEVKATDAVANPYLALAAILLAGEIGIAQQATLPEAVDGDPHLSKADVPLLPNDLGSVIELFEQFYEREKKKLKGVFPEAMASEMVAFRKSELADWEANGEAYNQRLLFLH